MSLALPDSQEYRIYSALCDRLTRDPVLKRVVKVFDFWDEKRAEPIGSQDAPYVGLFVSGNNDSLVVSYDKTETNLYLDVLLVVDGTNARDALNLWDAVRKALFPADGSVQKLLQDNHAHFLGVTTPGYGAKEVEGNRNLVTTAQIICKMLKSTGV